MNADFDEVMERPAAYLRRVAQGEIFMISVDRIDQRRCQEELKRVQVRLNLQESTKISVSADGVMVTPKVMA